MSLLRLLNLGRAMPQVKGMGRYNLAKQHMLPTFGSQKKSDKTDTGKIESLVAPSVAPAEVAKTEAKPSPIALPQPEKAAVGWLKRANPFAGSPATVPAVKAGNRAAQPELSLDQVKVVRSDLSEADVAVLPKAPAGSTIPPKRYVRPEKQPDELGKKAWGALGARLFGNAAAKH